MKKIIGIITGVVALLASIITIICLKIAFPFKPSFYSYSSYFDEKTVEDINKKYSYKEYGDVNSFEFALENNKIIGGITSDYAIITLINVGKVSPLRKKMEQIMERIKPNCFLNNTWEEYFTPEAVEQMNSFDPYLDQKLLQTMYGNEYGSKYVFSFSDFVIPYFINDKLLAYDTSKVFNEINMPKDPFNFTQAPTLVQALNALRGKLNDIQIQWTKNERENIALGSSINNPENNWDTTITSQNYSELINNFANMIFEGTGASISNIKRNLFDSDSDIILNNLINPTSKIDAAFIYNGDALDAYYGHDNFSAITDGDRLRIIRTKYTVRILDCFVISSSIDDNEQKKLLEYFNDIIFKDIFVTEEELNKSNPETIYQDNVILRIFDYVNYTPTAKSAYDYIYKNYFYDEETQTYDEIARSIFQVSSTNEQLGIYVKNLSPIDKETLSKLTLAFQKKLNGY